MLAVFNVCNKVGFNRKCAGPPLLPKKRRDAPLPAKAELTFLAVADGRRRERPMIKSLPRCLSFLVK